MATKRQYSEDEKAYALAAIETYRGNVQLAAKHCQIPYMTLKHWQEGIGVNDTVTEIGNVKKGELADLFEEEIRRAFGALDGKVADACYKDVVTGIGILTDKMQILRGQPSTITHEYAELSDDELRRRIAEFETEMARLDRDAVESLRTIEQPIKAISA